MSRRFSGDIVHRRRLAMGLSVADLARKMWDEGEPVSTQAIYAWEDGRAEPSGRRLVALAKVLGLEPERFYEED